MPDHPDEAVALTLAARRLEHSVFVSTGHQVTGLAGRRRPPRRLGRPAKWPGREVSGGIVNVGLSLDYIATLLAALLIGTGFVLHTRSRDAACVPLPERPADH